MHIMIIQFDFDFRINREIPNLGPFHMSPVNRAGSVSEISPRHSFLCKNIDVFI